MEDLKEIVRLVYQALEEKKAEWRTFSRAVNAIVSPAQA